MSAIAFTPDESELYERLKAQRPSTEVLLWLNKVDPRMLACRDLGDGRYAGVSRLMFHWTLKVGRIGDEDGYDDRWCYQEAWDAIVAMTMWDGTGDPAGWHRHPKTGRRRESGDPAKETVA